MNRLWKGLTAAMLLVLSACSSSDEELNPAASAEGGALSSHAVNLPPTGGEWHLTVTSISPWHLEIPGSCKWVKVSQSSGSEGTTNLVISADINAERKDRSVTIICSADDESFSETVSIKQTFPYLRIRRSDDPDWDPTDTLRFDWNQYAHSLQNPDGIRIHVESNVNWRIVPENGDANTLQDTLRTHEDVFLGLSVLEGNGPKDLDILPYSQNIDLAYKRVCFQLIPVIATASGSYTDIRSLGQSARDAVDGYTIKARQRNLKFLVNDSPRDKSYSLSELNEEISFDIDSETAWEIDPSHGNPSWLRFSASSAPAGKSVLTVTADGVNPTRQSREATVRLLTPEGAFRDIRIDQRPFILDVSQPSIGFLNNDPSVKTMTVKTTGGISLTETPDWLVCSISAYDKADSTYTLSFSLDENVGQNLSFTTLSTEGMMVESTENDLTCPVSITQEPFKFDLDIPDKLKSALATDDTDAYPVHLTVSGPWSVTIDGDWIAFSGEDGNPVTSGEAGEADLLVKAKSANEDKSESRTAVIELSSTAHADRGVPCDPLRLEIVQNRFVFELTDTDGGEDFSNFTLIPAHQSAFPEYVLLLKCSVPWTLTAPEWLEPSLTEGGADDSFVRIRFTPSSNETIGEDREGVITIRPTIGEPETISVRQEAFVWEVVAPEELTLDADDTEEREYTMDCSADWTVTSSDEAVVSVAKKDDHAFTVTPSKNETEEERTADIQVKSAVGDYIFTIHVVQHPALPE